VFDAYTVRARLAPAVVAVLPALAMLGLAFVGGDEVSTIPFIILGAAGLVVTGLVRDRGRDLEPGLWRSWGGAPTTQRLRWAGAPDMTAVAGRHEQLRQLTGRRLPDAAEEASDPTAADACYAEAVGILRQRTRDPDKFRVLFSENCDYGFRRNSLGLKPFALPVAVLAGLASAAVLAEGVGESGFDAGRWILTLVVSVVLAGYWALIVRPQWVHRSAERYTDRLVEELAGLTAPGGGTNFGPSERS
jgi:hypothetical protein